MPCSTCEKLRKIFPVPVADKLRQYERHILERRKAAKPQKSAPTAPRAKG